ncbi:MAG: DUF255 domain-containing protein [Hyphomicrobiaceae bacterium]
MHLRTAVLVALGLILATAAVAAPKPKPGAKANRLLNAASPYLRQHAYNPVDWYEWGPEAFAKAKREKKPIFLSVGYATCYWCHVMARESFADADVAKLLNAHTIPVKVDRERRPDVDATYMLATELIAQRGGWPNSVVLTPDLKPFFGFGYVPRDQFKDMIKQVATGWREQRPVIIADAERLSDIIAQAMNRRANNVAITQAVLRRASMHILARFDVFNGGLGTAPKFPQENIIQFLLHRGERDDDKVSLDAALLTLDNMIRGGIHDHVAGGFHRYATDNAWAIPHFEKMLYNQALTTRALLKAYELTGERRYAEAARAALDFVLRDMMTAAGGLASAFDAETDGKEGLFYMWSDAAFKAALGADAAFGAAIFGVTGDGNHEGLNTLRLVAPVGELAAAQKMTRDAFEKRYGQVLAKLGKARATRKPLIRDDKIVAGWNALMVRVLARASVVLDEPRYRAAALRVQTFINDKLGGANGDLKRAYYDGAASLEATQTDYAFSALSALALYDVTRDKQWLANAARLAEKMVERFADKTAGGLFLTRTATGFTRTKEIDDSTIPSGNAAALELFARLAQRTQDVRWPQHVLAQQAALSGIAVAEPVSHAATLLAADIATRGETGPRQAAAHGALHVTAKRLATGNGVRVRIQLAPGWHINSVTPKQDFLLPTKVRVEGLERDAITFPEAIERKLGFHDEPLSLYEGAVDIRLALPQGAAGRAARRMTLDLQACSDRICLDPQVVRLLLPAAQSPRS